MAREVTCPTCHHQLLIPDSAAGRWLTCPRCLASVGNPNVLLPGAITPAEGGTPRTEPPAPPPRESIPPPAGGVCPWCNREVESSWRVCPHCEGPLRGAGRQRALRSADEEVRGDSKGVGIGLIGLGLVGGLGILILVCGGGLSALGLGNTRQVVGVAFMASIVLLGLVIVGMSLSAAGRETAGRMVGAMLGGLAVALLVLVLLLTAFIYSVASCLEPCHGNPRPTANPPAPPKPGP